MADLRFTDEPWETPRSDLSAEDYCAVSLIDMNPPGAPKVKARCKLPVRKTPGGPINRNALRAAAAAIMGARGGLKVPPDVKREAARKLVRLMLQAGIRPGEGLLRLAGLKRPPEPRK